MLLAQHPQWAKNITEIELQDNKKDIDGVLCTPQELNVINDLVSRLPQGRVRENARSVFKTSPQNPQLWMALLFAALPNAKAIRFVPTKEYEDTHIYRAFLWYQAGMGLWARMSFLQYSQSRIQTLTVRAPSDIHDLVGISHLINLKTLIIDGEYLRSANLFGYCPHTGRSAILGRTHPIGILPNSLDTLHIYGNERNMPWRWFFELQRHQCSQTIFMPNIARLKIRLYFDIPCRTLARFLVYHFEPETYQMTSAADLFRSWQRWNIDVQTYFQDPVDGRDAFDCSGLYTRGDLPEEVLGPERKAALDPWWQLQPGEERKGAGWRK